MGNDQESGRQPVGRFIQRRRKQNQNKNGASPNVRGSKPRTRKKRGSVRGYRVGLNPELSRKVKWCREDLVVHLCHKRRMRGERGKPRTEKNGFNRKGKKRKRRMEARTKTKRERRPRTVEVEYAICPQHCVRSSKLYPLRVEKNRCFVGRFSFHYSRVVLKDCSQVFAYHYSLLSKTKT